MIDPNENVISAFSKTEIDQEMEAFIATAQEQFGAPEDEATPAPETSAPTPEAGTPEVPVEPVPAAPEEKAPEERGLERLVAREVELRAREDRLKGTEAEIEALRTRLRELEPRAISQDLLNKIKLSPADGLRALGLDPDEIVRTALMEKIGDKATPEIKEMMEKTRMQREIEALRAHVFEAERRQAAQAYYNTIETGARNFAGNIEGLSKDAPTVAHVAKSNPQRVFHEIMEEITRDAAARSAREPNGDVISYEEAAKRVEGRWSQMKALLTPAEIAAQAPNTASTPAKTIVEASKPTPPAKNPTNTSAQPPDRPIAPWLQRSLDLEEGVRAGLEEWRRVESKK